VRLSKGSDRETSFKCLTGAKPVIVGLCCYAV
jgi:hypothetical protein